MVDLSKVPSSEQIVFAFEGKKAVALAYLVTFLFAMGLWKTAEVAWWLIGKLF